MIEVKEITTRQTFPLRWKILWPHLSRLDQCELATDSQPGTFHVGVLQNNEIQSIGTFLKEKNIHLRYSNQYRLRAMATLPEARRKGFGKKIIEYGIKKLKQTNTDILWCDARKNALPFYEKLNFIIASDFYEVPGIGLHKLMYYKIKKQ